MLLLLFHVSIYPYTTTTLAFIYKCKRLLGNGSENQRDGSDGKVSDAEERKHGDRQEGGGERIVSMSFSSLYYFFTIWM